MCWAFVVVILEDKTHIDPTIWLIFGSVVIGNRTATKALNSLNMKKKDDHQ